MATNEENETGNGKSMSSNEYAGLVLAVIVPFVGLAFGLYLRHEGSQVGNRIIVISIISAVIWLSLAILI